MGTAPTAAMEFHFGLSAFHLQVEGKAETGNYRIRYNEQWKSKCEVFCHAHMEVTHPTGGSS
jgi:hypothetical protein